MPKQDLKKKIPCSYQSYEVHY